MSDIVLVHPLRFKGQNEEKSLAYSTKFMPLGLLSIGTFLENNGFKVKIIDGAMNSNFLDDLMAEVKKNPILVGLSVMTPHIESALEMSALIKSVNPEMPVVWGGVHPTFYPEMTIKNKFVDYVVFGEGEYTLLELISAIKNKTELSQIDGLAYKVSGEIRINKSRTQLDINKMPNFNYDLLEVEKYILKDIDADGRFGGMVKRVMPILAGLGCPYKCTFCINSSRDCRYRPKPVSRIIEEIDYVVKKYKAEYIRLEDEIFLLDKKKVEEFLENLEKKDYKIYWWATARANFFQDPEAIDSLLAKMKKLGCFHLGIGVESGSRHMLEFYKKQITLEQVEKAAMMCNKYDFPVIYPFIVGSPHETTEEVFMSLKFAGKLKKIHPGGTMIFHTFRPHPGCELYNEAVNLGFKNPQTLEEWIPKSRSSVRGYCSLADLPWLKNPEFLEYLAIFGELTYQKLSRIKLLLRPLVFLESLVFKMRLKFNFWHLLLEKELYFFLKKHGLFTYIRKILRN